MNVVCAGTSARIPAMYPDLEQSFPVLCITIFYSAQIIETKYQRVSCLALIIKT